MSQSGHFITVARVGDLGVGTGRHLRLRGRQVALFHTQDGYAAIDGVCPHKGAPLGEGTVSVGGDGVHCPLHGWHFDLRTGACLDRPDRPVQTFPVRIVGDEVQIELPPDPKPVAKSSDRTATIS